MRPLVANILGLSESENKKVLGQIFDTKDSAKKASDEREASLAQKLDDGSLTPEQEAAIAALPVVQGKGGFLDDVDTHGHQYFIFKYGKTTFLVDTQGYDYPRYVLVLSPKLLRKLHK